MSDEHAGVEGTKILLVDDQLTNLDVLRDVMETKGYGVLFAPSGKIALRSAGMAKPDLILLDVEMPEMDGLRGLGGLTGRNVVLCCLGT